MSQLFPLFFASKGRDDTAAGQRETTPGGSEAIRWEVVANAPGLAPAAIIGGRLEAEGIPVRTWQEGAGQAIGLTVGILGTAYVAVPEAYAGRARDILDEVDAWDVAEDEPGLDEET